MQHFNFIIIIIIYNFYSYYKQIIYKHASNIAQSIIYVPQTCDGSKNNNNIIYFFINHVCGIK